MIKTFTAAVFTGIKILLILNFYNCFNFVKKLQEQKFSVCALNNHEKFLQFVFHNFV